MQDAILSLWFARFWQLSESLYASHCCITSQPQRSDSLEKNPADFLITERMVVNWDAQFSVFPFFPLFTQQHIFSWFIPWLLHFFLHRPFFCWAGDIWEKSSVIMGSYRFFCRWGTMRQQKQPSSHMHGIWEPRKTGKEKWHVFFLIRERVCNGCNFWDSGLKRELTNGTLL